MKSPGAVYKKLREAKYRRLVELYRKFLRRDPELCKYNQAYRIQTDSVVKNIRLCMLHQQGEGIVPHLLDICQEIEHCTQCNAYVPLHTKDSVRTMFEAELRNPAVKAKKYPEICALEWVLEQEAADISIIYSWISRLIYRFKALFRIWPAS